MNTNRISRVDGRGGEIACGGDGGGGRRLGFAAAAAEEMGEKKAR